MKIQLIETGEIEEADGLWGERLIEHGKAIPVIPKAGKPAKKAEATVTDKAPEVAEAEEPKAGPEKKAGKKR